MPITRRNLLVAATAAATALSISRAGAAEKGVLRVTAASSDLNSMWLALVAGFEAAFPAIKVDFDNSNRSYDDLVQVTLRDALTGSLPDVSFQGANRIRIYTDRNLAVSLDGFLSADASASRKELSPSVESVGKFNGKTYALGFGVAVPVIFYNLDLVKRAGQDPAKLPTDWEGIIDLAKRIQALGNGTLCAYFQYDSADWLWMSLVQSQGGRMLSPDERKVAFDGPEGLRALQILQGFGKAGQSAVDMSRDQARQLFVAGSMGIIIDSVSNLTAFQKAAQGRFTLGTQQFPLSGTEGRLPAAGSVAMMFARDPERQKLAWEFLKFASGFAGQKIVGTQSGWLPANDGAIQSMDVLGGYYAENPLMKPALAEIPSLTGWYAFPGENAVKITSRIVDHMRTVVTLKQAPADALAAMTKDVQSLLPG